MNSNQTSTAISQESNVIKFGHHRDALSTQQKAEMNMELLATLSKYSGTNWMDIGLHKNYPTAFHVLIAVVNEVKAGK